MQASLNAFFKSLWTKIQNVQSKTTVRKIPLQVFIHSSMAYQRARSYLDICTLHFMKNLSRNTSDNNYFVHYPILEHHQTHLIEKQPLYDRVTKAIYIQLIFESL